MIRKLTSQGNKRRVQQSKFEFEKLEPRAMLSATVAEPIELSDVGIVEVFQTETESIGRLFYDANDNGTREGDEYWLTNWMVYGDNNNNLAVDSDESLARTNEYGWYHLRNLNEDSVVTPLIDDYSDLNVTDESLANTETEQPQGFADVASHDGGSIIVWASLHQDGNGWGVYGQQYDAIGQKSGDEFRVNTTIISSQFAPSVSAFDNGDFVVAWMAYTEGNWDIFAQMFRADGVKIGSQNQVNATHIGNQTNPVVQTLDNGNYVVGWQGFASYENLEFSQGVEYSLGTESIQTRESALGFDSIGVFEDSQNIENYLEFDNSVDLESFQSTTSSKSFGVFGVFARVMDQNGVGVSNEIRISHRNRGGDQQFDIAALPDGGFAVVFEGSSAYDYNGIYAKTFDGYGHVQGHTHLVNQIRHGKQWQPAVTTDEVGNLFVSYTSKGDGSGIGVYVEKLDSNLHWSTGVKQVAQEFLGAQWRSDIVVTLDGNVAITWQGRGDSDQDGVFIREFTNWLRPLGAELRLSDSSDGSQRYASVDSSAAGVTLAWHGEGDGDLLGVYTRSILTETIPSNVAPEATDFVLEIIQTGGSRFSVTATDIISVFGVDDDSNLNSMSVSFGSAFVSIDGSRSGGGIDPSQVGFTYAPLAGTIGSFVIDTEAASAFDGLMDGQTANVAIDYTVTDGVFADTGVFSFSYVEAESEFDNIDFDFVGPTMVDQELMAMVEAMEGEALFEAVIGDASDIAAALSLVDFTPGSGFDIQPLLDNAMLTVAAVAAKETTASTSTAASTAANRGQAFAAAEDGSVASSQAFSNSVAQSSAVGGSAASALANENSNAIATATDGSAAESTSEVNSDASTTASNASVATSTSLNDSESTANSDDGSSATAFSADTSVADASALDSSIANTVALDNSNANSDAQQFSDALAIARSGSTANSSAMSMSSSSTAAENDSAASATAEDGSTVTSIADDNSNSTSVGMQASVSSAISVEMGSTTTSSDQASAASGIAQQNSVVNAISNLNATDGTLAAATHAFGYAGSEATAEAANNSLSLAAATYNSTATTLTDSGSSAQSTASASADVMSPDLPNNVTDGVADKIAAIVDDVTVAKAALADFAMGAISEFLAGNGVMSDLANVASQFQPVVPTAPAAGAESATAESTALNNSIASSEAIDGSTASSVADMSSVAAAQAVDDSTAESMATNGSVASTTASFDSEATSTADSGSIVASVSENESNATATGSDLSTASASAAGSSVVAATAVETGDATAVGIDNSSASAEASQGSLVTATADNQSEATAAAASDSMATATATNDSTATSVAQNMGTSEAIAEGNSDATTLAENGSTANADAEDMSSATATADDSSIAAATAIAASTAVASADEDSNSTAFASDASVSSAEALKLGISDAVAIDGSAASSTAEDNSDAIAFSDSSSASEATATGFSSASASADTGSIADASAATNSTATATSTGLDSFAFSAAELDSTAAAEANLGMSDAIAFSGNNSTAGATATNNASSTASAFNDSDAIANAADDGSLAEATADHGFNAFASAFDASQSMVTSPDSSLSQIEMSVEVQDVNGEMLPTLSLGTLDTALMGTAGSPIAIPILATEADGEMFDEIVIGALPAGSILSAGTSNADGTAWTFTDPPPADLTLTTPGGFTGEIEMSITIEVDRGSMSGPSTVEGIQAIVVNA